MITNSTPSADGSKPLTLNPKTTCVCQDCGQPTKDQSGRSLRCNTCFRISRRRAASKACERCGKEFTGKPSKVAKQAFCSRSCASIVQAAVMPPEMKSKRSDTMRGLATSHPGFLRRYEKMTGESNPMKSEETRKKVSVALSGRPSPHLNGGNGTGMTVPQAMLLEALGTPWVPEFLVWGRGQHDEWPLMLVDLAVPDLKIAIEVDGQSHNTLKVRERDKKKERLLNEAGWRIIRVKNSEVLADLNRCVSRVREFLESSQPGGLPATI